MMVFTSDIGAEILSQTEKWHKDGTFKKRPKLFYQILTIWELYNDYYLITTMITYLSHVHILFFQISAHQHI